MNQISIQINASTVAWYGAIVATLALIGNLVSVTHRILQDRFNVKLEINPGMIILPYGMPPHDKDELFTSFNIINKGIRPVTITHAGFYMNRKKAGQYNSAVINAFGSAGELPKEIPGGGRHGVLALQSEITKHLDKIEYFEVIAATGKKFKRRMTRKLKERFKK